MDGLVSQREGCVQETDSVTRTSERTHRTILDCVRLADRVSQPGQAIVPLRELFCLS